MLLLTPPKSIFLLQCTGPSPWGCEERRPACNGTDLLAAAFKVEEVASTLMWKGLMDGCVSGFCKHMGRPCVYLRAWQNTDV